MAVLTAPVPPPVTIIIPALNHWEECTQPLLEHLSDQRAWLHDAEVLIVDDGSTDETTQHTAEDWTGFCWEVLHLSENRGFTAACNAGAAAAQGDVLIFLNNDTQPLADWLAPLLDELAAGAGLVGSLLVEPGWGDGRAAVQSAGLAQRPDGTWCNRTDAPAGRRAEQALCGACLAIRRAAFWRLGGFDEGFEGGGGCDDVDLCLRAGRAGLPVVLRPDSVVVHCEGTTRFARPETRAQLAANQQRLQERWGVPAAAAAEEVPDGPVVVAPGSSDGGDAPGDAGGGPVHDEQRRLPGRGAGDARPLVVAWDGSRNVEQAGSLAHINHAVVAQLATGLVRPDWQVCVLEAPTATAIGLPLDAYVSHYWPGPQAAWRPPPERARVWVIIAPWELSRYPEAWDAAFCSPKFRRLLTPSEHSRRLFLAGGVLREDQVRVVPNGVDTAAFCPDGPTFPVRAGSEGLWVALFVGGLLWRKGVDLLYQAWDRAFTKDEPVRLVLKAQGTQSFYQGQALLPPQGHPTIRLLDRHLPPPELASLYRAAAVVVLPSRAEGFGLPALEGMACGRPVLVPEGTAMAEFVPGEAGLLVPPRTANLPPGAVEPNIDLLARALRWCYEHRDEAAALGAAGRQAALAYDWRHIAERYAQELEEVCGA